MLPEVARWQRERSDLRVAVVSRGPRALNLAKMTDNGLTTLLIATDREIARSYCGVATPSAVLVGADGLIASNLVEGAVAIRALAATSGSLSAHLSLEVEDAMITANNVDRANLQSNATTVEPVISLESRPKPHPEVATTELEGEAVVYDPRTGQVHQLNPTATLVWSLCDGDMAVLDIAEAIAGIYGISTDEASLDVHDLLAKFSTAGLVVVS